MKRRMAMVMTALMALALLMAVAGCSGSDTPPDGDGIADGDEADDNEDVEIVGDGDAEPDVEDSPTDGDVTDETDATDPEELEEDPDIADPDPDGDIEPDLEDIQTDGDDADDIEADEQGDIEEEPEEDQPADMEETEAEEEEAPDTTAPEVVATVPQDQSVQPIDLRTIRIEFSEKLANDSIDWSAIHLYEQGHADQPILFNGSHDDFSGDVSVLTLTVASDTAFAYYKTYEVAIDGDVFTDRAADPNYLAAYSFSFTIADDPDPVPPVIESSDPPNGATGVAVGLTAVVIDFSEPLAAEPFDWAGVQVYPEGCDNSGCYLDMDKVRSEETDPDHTRFTLGFNPAARLDWETTYVVHFDGDTFWDTGDNSLAETSVTFTTVVNPDPVPPVIAAVTPGDGAVDVPQSLNTITVDFSEPLASPFDWAALRVYLQACGDHEGCYASYAHSDSTQTGNDGDFTRFVLTLPNPVVYSGTYVLHFDADAFFDTNGNALGDGAAVETTFTIEDEPDVTAPEVASSVPQNNGSDVSADLDMIQIDFSEVLKESTIDFGAIVLRPQSCGEAACHIAFTGNHSLQTDPETQTQYSRFVLTVNPEDIDYSTVYVVTLAGDTFADLSDNLLAATDITFTTAAQQDTTDPTVESTTPGDGATAVAKTLPSVYITFSEQLSSSAFDLAWASLYPQGEPGNPVEVTKIRRELVGPASVKTQIEMTIVQLGGLDYDTTYVIALQDGMFQDLAGNVLAGQTSFGFTTETAPVDGDLDVVELEPEPEIDEEEAPAATGSITGTLYTTSSLLLDLKSIQLFDQPPVDQSVVPLAVKTNPSTNPAAGTAFYTFGNLTAGTYWLRAWVDTNINNQIEPLTEWAMHTADPIDFDPAVQTPVVADMYYGVTESALGEMSGRIYLPSGAFSTSMKVYVKVFREDPDSVSTAPVAVTFGTNPSTATRSFAWQIDNLANGDHWVRAWVDVCNDGIETNDVEAVHGLNEPLVIADDFISGIDFTYSDAVALACGSDGDIDTELELEEIDETADLDVTGCSSDNDCSSIDDVCHYQANDGAGACALPCTSDSGCRSLFGDTFFCGPSENLIRRCYENISLPAAIPDAPAGPLDILFSVSDTGTIGQQACLSISIEHPDMGEIWIKLISAEGSRADDVYYYADPGVANLDTTISVVSFNGETRGGFWHLIIEDSVSGNTGQLLGYSLAFDDACPAADGDTDTVDIVEEETAPRPGSCEDPFSSSVIASEMTGIESLMDPTGCSNITDASGPDRVHAFSLTGGVPFSVTVTSYDQFDVVLYIMNPCSNTPDICEGVDAVIGTGPETLNFTPEIGGTYYLVVDSKGAATGDYELFVNN